MLIDGVEHTVIGVGAEGAILLGPDGGEHVVSQDEFRSAISSGRVFDRREEAGLRFSTAGEANEHRFRQNVLLRMDQHRRAGLKVDAARAAVERELRDDPTFLARQRPFPSLRSIQGWKATVRAEGNKALAPKEYLRGNRKDRCDERFEEIALDFLEEKFFTTDRLTVSDAEAAIAEAYLLGLVGWRYGRALVEALPAVEQSLGLELGVLLLPQAPERLALVDGTIDGDAIERTVAALRAWAIDRPGKTIPFSSIGLRRTTDRGALIEALRGIFSGSIAPVAAPDDAALGAFEFLSAEIEGAVARLRRGRGWTAQQVAEVTGWKEACVSAWCRQGLIAATPFPRSRGIGYTIEPEALAAFQTRYVTVAALARDAGCSPRGMLRRLADAGVLTHGVFTDGTARRGHVVRIADLVSTVATSAPATTASGSITTIRRRTRTRSPKRDQTLPRGADQRPGDPGPPS
ncbi:MAG: hypothetical protein ABTQ27_07155 [Amaricoccus sp.]|uniref:hypothetical protein n=1 Tax=Amaricoccus sp. TaxID=1872485 RepID=UPI0033153257